jgi:hypothetical protein
MKRATSAYMSGIAAAAGSQPRSTNLLRPPRRLYGAERILVGEQSTIGSSARAAAPAAPAMRTSTGIESPVTGPVATNPGPASPPLINAPSVTAEVPPAGVSTADVTTEAVAGPMQALNPGRTTRPALEQAEARGEQAPVTPPALERQPSTRRQQRELVAPVRGAEPVDRRPAPAAQLAATVAQAALTEPIQQPQATEAPREPRAPTLEPISTTPIGPYSTPRTASPAPARPSTREQQAPAVQIGVIDVTVLPAPAAPVSIAPQAPAPATAEAGAPLSRGVGSWYGLAQR